MEHIEQKIDYATLISYAFTQYSLKRRLKDTREKGETEVIEELYQSQMKYTFRPKFSQHLTKEEKR